jgi:hypothetical protein
MRLAAALLTVACCIGAAAPSAHAVGGTPRYQLLGDWSFHGHRYRFVSRGGAVYGRALSRTRVGPCVVRAGTELFRGFRFRGTRGGADLWRGRLAMIRTAGCTTLFVSSTITQSSDLSITETSRQPGDQRPPPTSFNRVRPPLSAHDPVLATWVRAGAGVVVRREGRLYVGRAREAYVIANGCTVAAGTVVWRLRPLAPGRYSGTIQTFFGPPGCAQGKLAKSLWLFADGHEELLRESGSAPAVAYIRAPEVSSPLR